MLLSIGLLKRAEIARATHNRAKYKKKDASKHKMVALVEQEL